MVGTSGEVVPLLGAGGEHGAVPHGHLQGGMLTAQCGL